MEKVKAMSLFNQTVARVAELETELAAAHERIRNLEIALKAARADKIKALGSRGYSASSYPSSTPAHDLNSLSESDVEELFKMREQELVQVEAEAALL